MEWCRLVALRPYELSTAVCGPQLWLSLSAICSGDFFFEFLTFFFFPSLPLVYLINPYLKSSSNFVFN